MAALETAEHDLAEYDLVVIGGPIWAFTICSPTRTYAATHRREFGEVAYFAIAGNATYVSGGARALEEATGIIAVATLGLTDKLVNDYHQAQPAQFVNELSM